MSTATEEIIEKLKTITLFEAKELVLQIEQTFGVDASISTGSAMIPSESSSQTVAPIEEKTTFNVILEEIAGDKRVAVLKVIRQCTSLGLKEAKEFTTSLPKPIKEGISKEEADTIKKQLEEAGGKVIIN